MYQKILFGTKLLFRADETTILPRALSIMRFEVQVEYALGVSAWTLRWGCFHPRIIPAQADLGKASSGSPLEPGQDAAGLVPHDLRRAQSQPDWPPLGFHRCQSDL